MSHVVSYNMSRQTETWLIYEHVLLMKNATVTNIIVYKKFDSKNKSSQVQNNISTWKSLNWRHNVYPKCWYLPKSPQCVTTQNSIVKINIGFLDLFF
jgi:hypothetical protein